MRLKIQIVLLNSYYASILTARRSPIKGESLKAKKDVQLHCTYTKRILMFGTRSDPIYQIFLTWN